MLTDAPVIHTDVFRDIQRVMTDEQQQKIISLADHISETQWQAGDLVNEIYAQVQANGIPATLGDVCALVSDRLYGEYQANTLRIYASIASFYPVHVRVNIPMIVPFWMFRYATRFGKDFQKVFDFAQNFMDTRGRLPYSREVKDYFEPAQALFRNCRSEIVVPGGGDSYDVFPCSVEPEPSCGVFDGKQINIVLHNLVSGLTPLISLAPQDKRQKLAQMIVLARQVLDE